jgi:hypothetical protein
MEGVWLQQDGTLAHFSLTVHNILNKYYPGCWIGCGSPSPMPLT